MLFTFLLSLNVLAGEPDNFSARHEGKAPVVNAEINKVVNMVLDYALEDFSSAAKPSCDREKFLKFIEDDLDRNLPRIYRAMEVNVPIAGPRNHEDVPYRAGKPYTRLYFSPSYKVKVKDREFYVGLDKIDHFFSHGSLYWDIVGKDAQLPAAKVKKALEVGVMQEQATWGLQKTQVKSYADLCANYQGLHFWRDLFDGKPPIVACKNGRFVKNRQFDMADYFVPTMDETINCNSYASEEVFKAISDVTNKWGMKCPAVDNVCDEFKKQYKDFAPLLMHPLCLGTGTSQIEKASPMTTKDVMDTAQAAMSGGVGFLFFKYFGKGKYTGGVK
ncbi:hypothetical protein [Bdellovibrio svalbardensis]|nr:hypothetical protein [Bdellovibrio svalbardensis]